MASKPVTSFILLSVLLKTECSREFERICNEMLRLWIRLNMYSFWSWYIVCVLVDDTIGCKPSCTTYAYIPALVYCSL